MAKKKIPSLTYECVGYLLEGREIDFRQIAENVNLQYGSKKRVSNVSYAFSQLYKSDLGYFMVRTGKGGGKDPYKYSMSEEGLKLSRKMAYNLYLRNNDITLENINKKVPKLTEKVEESKDLRDPEIIGDRWKRDTAKAETKAGEGKAVTRVKPVKKDKTVLTIVPPPEKAEEAAAAANETEGEDRLVELIEKLLDRGITIRHSLEFSFKIRS